MTELTPQEAWEEYLETANPSGSTENGAVDLYDIEGMNEAAFQLFEIAQKATARADAAAEQMRERCAAISENARTGHHIVHSIKTGVFPDQTEWRDVIADLIRALPLHEEMKE